MTSYTKRVYVAFDGKEFDTEKGCTNYEQEKYEFLRNKFLSTGSCVFRTDNNKYMYVYLSNAIAIEPLTKLFSYGKYMDVITRSSIDPRGLELHTLHLYLSNDGGMHYKYIGTVDNIIKEFNKKIDRMNFYLHQYKDYLIVPSYKINGNESEIVIGI